MDISKRIQAFTHLGKELKSLSDEAIQSLAVKTVNQNPWFTESEIKFALREIGNNLTKENISDWVTPYRFSSGDKTIALIAAGNIPLVAFHDFLSILISGNKVLLKQSSKDSILLPFIAEIIIQINPNFREYIKFSKEKITDFDAVIATGSDNTARYFNYYFSKYPHIIRKNRTSCAILTGFESADDLAALGYDVFRYYGLGCRSISKLFVPAGFDITLVLDAWESYHDIIQHYKYANNYDYQKSIMLLNRIEFLDSGYVLMTESEKLSSPIGVVHFEFYPNDASLSNRLKSDADKIQCIVGNHSLASIPFGRAQSPKLDDYADQIDTLKFLSTF